MNRSPERAEDRAAEAAWTDVLDVGEVGAGELRTAKVEGYQLCVGRDEAGRLFCVDNRCPHEGYPLQQGYVAGGTLTCAWHNWKFDTKSGACVLGGEGVRAFPVRERNGRIEVDLAEPPPESTWPGLLESFHEGIGRHENGRAFRDGVRLLLAGFPPERLAAEIALHDARHAEYGTGHALAVAADVCRVLERYEGPRALVALAPAIDQCGDSNRRLPVRARPEPLADEGAQALLAAVEAEDAARAEVMLRGALAAGVGRAEVERRLALALTRHFLDFGHPLIYLVKARELLARLEAEEAERYAAELYPALLFSIVLGTREDTLPYLAPYARRAEEAAPDFAGWERAARADAPFDAEAFRAAALDAPNVEEACGALAGALAAGVSAERLAEELVVAAAERLLRFDLAVELDDTVAESWLWATHRFTFAAACRHAIGFLRSPERLRFLFQTLAFTHSGRAMDAPAEKRLPIEPQAADARGVLEAILARDPRRAVGRSAGLLAAGTDRRELHVALEELCLSDPLVRPIVVSHAIKTTWAGIEESEALRTHPLGDRPLLAAVRLLASPVIERRVRSQAEASIRWVADGIMPRKLTQ